MNTHSGKPSTNDIESKILELLHERSIESSICPSDAARALSCDDWRDLMPRVRECADLLAKNERIIVMQKGRPIASAVDAKGPIRLKLHRSKD